jgi:hypothetical protein
VGCEHKKLIWIPHQDDPETMVLVCRSCHAILDVLEPGGVELDPDPSSDEEDWNELPED